MTACAYNYHENLIGDSIEIRMTNEFIPYESYRVRGRESYEILNHEQRHFDISEIYVRRVREYITKWKGSNKEDYNAYLLSGTENIYHDSLAIHYESETTHDLNHQNQEKWNRKIDSLLKNYARFNKTVFRLHWPSTSSDFFGSPYIAYSTAHKLIIDTRDK